MSSEPPVTVLFVDDSATDRIRGTGLLRRQFPDWDVLEASGGAEALTLVARRRIDAVVTDLVMPEMDGRQFLAHMTEDYPNIPVVLITSQGNDQIAAQSMELGAVNYVPKRNLSNDLGRVINEILSSQREARQARGVLRHVTRHRTMFRIETDLEQVRSLVHFVRLRLHSLQRLGAATVRDLTAAVRECLLNAYFHGNLECNTSPLELPREEYIRVSEQRKDDPQFHARRIELELLFDSRSVSIRIADEGPGFDQATWKERAAERGSDTSRGQGMRIIRDAVSDFTLNARGNEMTLIREVTDDVPLHEASLGAR